MNAPPQSRQYRYYDFVMAAYVCILLCSNLIGPAKETSIEVPIFGTVTFLAGVLFFPISYIFGDILTEVYGYGRDRRVVWAGFGALAFASLMAAMVVHLPPSAASRATQASVEAVFGNTPRIVVASITAFWCGTFVNSYVLAKMKIWTRGRWLWTRIVGSTVCGELVDSVIFYFVAFYGRPPLLLLRRAPPDLKPGAPLSMGSFAVIELEHWHLPLGVDGPIILARLRLLLGIVDLLQLELMAGLPQHDMRR